MLLLLLLNITTGQAQEEFVPAPAKLIARFPFKLLTGGIITLRARVSNFPDTLTFILDTGSGGISLGVRSGPARLGTPACMGTNYRVDSTRYRVHDIHF
jgi:hypothetical protein